MVKQDYTLSRYASFWKRFLAYKIDVTIITLLTIPLFHSIAGDFWPDTDFVTFAQALNASILMGEHSPEVERFFYAINLFSICLIVISAVYHILFTQSRWQATPGKHFCHLKVLATNGAPLGLLHAAARHAATGISVLPLGLGFLLIFFTREKIALHDLLVRTRVIYARREGD